MNVNDPDRLLSALALPETQTDAVTRKLCATVYLDWRFAEFCREQLCHASMVAAAPSHGIDDIAVARHAVHAYELEKLRFRRVSAGIVFFYAALALAVVEAVNGSPRGALVMALIALLFLAAGAVVNVRSELASRRTALSLVRDQGHDPRESAPRLSAALEKSLAERSRANVVVYDAEIGADNPFIGSGWRITEAVWAPIDVGTAAKDASGNPLAIRSFTAADLHEFLIERMPGLGFEKLTAVDRLYVPGLSATKVPGLVPDPLRGPVSTVDERLVRAGVNVQGGQTRTYLCLQHVSRGGALVVSMYVRARLVQDRLTWETHAYVLPPLSPLLVSKVDKLPRRRNELFWDTVATHGFQGLPLVLAAPAMLLARPFVSSEFLEQQASGRHDVKRKRDVDYGAVMVIREVVSDFGEMGFAERTDAVDYFQRLQQGVLTATKEFLGEHNIDTSDLKTKQQHIVSMHTYNFTGDITGPGHIFGDHGVQKHTDDPPQSGE
ncbi:hypothetical protein [Actinomadura opuntiae]|uniref:hypothetical protein n=1 Tax=Actinomadura sp. OS1-43 TaxID=604315 RepID=UPI00255AFFB5|nr:hypothetical protein [Actinomadura sp. OS1-43]MDL4815998.1 hypothetical protein [Actinomadura sp. OS1-43]